MTYPVDPVTRRRRLAILIQFPIRGGVFGVMGGLTAGGVYGAVLGTGSEPSAGLLGDLIGGFISGCLYGAFFGSLLGFVSGLAFAIAVTLHVPRSRRGYVILARAVSVTTPLVLALLVAAGSRLSDSIDWVVFAVPGCIAAVTGWFLAPRALRPYLDTLTTGS